jgi:hypothetical protein
MRRFLLGLTMTTLPAFALSLLLAGCGSGDNKDKGASSSGGGDSATEASSGPAKPMEAKGGVLKGTITLSTTPDVKKLSEDLQATIAREKPEQKDFCMSGDDSEKTYQKYRIGTNGRLGNVFVWIVPASGTYFKVDKKAVEEAAKNPVKIRQPHCAFIPHSAFVWAEYTDPDKPTEKKQTGQYIEVVNDAAGTSHNTSYQGGSRNPKGDQTLPSKGTMKIEKLKSETTPMQLKCAIHTWMNAWVRLVDTPYYAISASDTLDGDKKVAPNNDKFGTYEIKNLPVGKVRVLAWHEECGYLTKTTGGDVIDIADGKDTTLNFEAKPK